MRTGVDVLEIIKPDMRAMECVTTRLFYAFVSILLNTVCCPFCTKSASAGDGSD